MKFQGLGYALCVGAVAILLSGCGGSQPSIDPTQQKSALPLDGQAEMSPDASGDLLYVANEGSDGSNGTDVSVLTYPQGKPVMTITGIGVPWGICSDKSGNVWVVTLNRIAYKFAHGGTKPIAELHVPNSDLATGCSVDPTTGNLAVINFSASKPTIDIWQNGRGSPTIYPVGAVACAYDNKGNLFADQNFGLAELPKGGSAFISISLDKSGKWGGGVEWDGKYIAVDVHNPTAPEGRRNVIYRVSVSGSTGTVVQTVHPRRLGVTGWIWVQGKTLIATVNRDGGSQIGFWHYPNAHEQFEKLSPFYAPWGITVSVGPR